MNLRPEQRAYAIYRLDATLDWIIRSDDWFRRSELGTRLMSTIVEIGSNKEAIFEMDAKYIVTDHKNLRLYRERLNEVIDEDDPDKRYDRAFEFELWLHEIGLLGENE